MAREAENLFALGALFLAFRELLKSMKQVQDESIDFDPGLTNLGIFREAFGANAGVRLAPPEIESINIQSGQPITLDGGRLNLSRNLDFFYQDVGTRHGVDPLLLKAIAMVESSENPEAVNPSDPSYGLMQILCRADCPTCPCKNRFNIQGWDQATPETLMDVRFNLDLAAQILRWNIDNFGFVQGIAVYNRWESRNDPSNGPFGNQGYVDKVLANFFNLGGAIP